MWDRTPGATQGATGGRRPARGLPWHFGRETSPQIDLFEADRYGGSSLAGHVGVRQSVHAEVGSRAWMSGALAEAEQAWNSHDMGRFAACFAEARTSRTAAAVVGTPPTSSACRRQA